MAASGELLKIPFGMGLKEDKKSISWWVDNFPQFWEVLLEIKGFDEMTFWVPI